MSRIFITGANRGLGLEFVRQCLERGAQVAATVRAPERAVELRKLKDAAEGRLSILQLDAESEASIKEAVAATAECLEGIDLLINNAGIARWKGMAEVSLDDLESSMRVNAFAPIFIVRESRNLLSNSAQPVVANISSMQGSIARRKTDEGSGANYAYCMSKAALNMASIRMAADLQEIGGIVIAQSPGWVKTDMGGKDAELTVEESVSKMLSLYERLKPEDSGRFLGIDGEELPW